MTYNETISSRIRESLENLPNVEEKIMFGGICFMVNDKMCVGVVGNEIMCRIGEERFKEALQRTGCREMDFAGRPMKGYVFVAEEGLKTPADFNYWINLCLEYTPKAKSSKKKK